MGDSPDRAGWRRRGVLRALALAPAALAGCTTAGAERAGMGANAAAGASANGGELEPQPALAPAAIAAVRAFPLPPDAEPAFVFRAAARSREPR